MCVEAASMYKHDGLLGHTSPVEVVDADTVEHDVLAGRENDLVDRDARCRYDGPEMIEFIGQLRSNSSVIARSCCVVDGQLVKIRCSAHGKSHYHPGESSVVNGAISL